jgi:hypothetical protein
MGLVIIVPATPGGIGRFNASFLFRIFHVAVAEHHADPATGQFLREGREPIARIMEAVGGLKDDEALRLVVPFLRNRVRNVEC